MRYNGVMVIAAGGFAVALAALAGSCGSVAVEHGGSNASASGSTTGAGGAGGVGTTSVTSGDIGGGIGFGGFAATGGGSGGSPGMPGLFDCGGCLCDGTTHYCRFEGGGGPTPPPGPPPAPLCADDAGVTSCKPIPAECLSSPTCNCLGKPDSICSCEVMAPGILVKCINP